jgi:kynurenine formamidase
MARQLIDLSQEIYHNDLYGQHPLDGVPYIMPFMTHEGSRKELDGKFSFEMNMLNMIEHTCTHMDAQRHVSDKPDAMTVDKAPLEWFYSSAVCLDMSHIPEQGWYTKDDVVKALEKANLEIQPNDVVLFYTGHYARHHGTPKYAADAQHPGPEKSVTEYLADKGVHLWGVECCAADNPLDQRRNYYPNHEVLRDRNLMHIENLCNLEKVAGKRFTFIGFPLKIRNGTGSPFRAVAVLDE